MLLSPKYKHSVALKSLFKCIIPYPDGLSLIQSLDRSHGGLDVQGLHILPVLLQQGDEEVHGQVHVLSKLLLGHLHVADGDIQTENLLHLELDGGLEVQHLGLDVIVMGDEGRELTSLSRGRYKDGIYL